MTPILIMILLIGFIRNMYFNIQVQNIRANKPHDKPEKIWHTLNVVQIFMIVGVASFYSLKAIPAFLIYWVVTTFIMGYQQKGTLTYFGDGKGNFEEELLTKFSKLIKVKYETLALIFRILILMVGVVGVVIIDKG